MAKKSSAKKSKEVGLELDDNIAKDEVAFKDEPPFQDDLPF